MAVNIVEKVDGQVAVKNALVSVSDKSDLEELVNGLVAACPEVTIYSTGGTFARIKEILGDDSARLKQVSDYTGQPETQGGLVKTLDFKIYLGLLTETYNEDHQMDMERTGAVPIDLVVVNLYPFRATISKGGVTPEQARGQIDIGGPCMIRASAKNFLRVACVVEPADYPDLLEELSRGGGKTSLGFRYRLARKAFALTAAYDRAIADYLAQTPFVAVSPCYEIKG
ncbi:MAG: hypothetical protein JRI97_03510 [Deltaproteobacteria bacterium]|nr:hypothetical protein [Deltaproteobacteria bacterium]